MLPADFLPESWKETKLLVRSKVEEDEDVLKSRQQLVESKTPAELGNISGLSDIPVPTRIQTLMRTKKRNLKSTEEKAMSKKVRYKTFCGMLCMYGYIHTWYLVEVPRACLI